MSLCLRNASAISLLGALAACRSTSSPRHDVDAQPTMAPVVKRAAPLAAESKPIPQRLAPVPVGSLCVTSGAVTSATSHGLHVDMGGMRLVLAKGRSRSAELEFTYRGASETTAKLGNGELRRQIGLKLRAQDTCNVVYVMWHIEPKPGIVVQVKRNAFGASRHECADGGYVTVAPESASPAPMVAGEAARVLRADLDGTRLVVRADGSEVWRGRLPDEILTFDGPVGVRSDNGSFDFELRAPEGDLIPLAPSDRCIKD